MQSSPSPSSSESAASNVNTANSKEDDVASQEASTSITTTTNVEEEIDGFIKRFLSLGATPTTVAKSSTFDARLKRHLIIDKVLGMCEPEDLVYLSKRLDEFKRDFFSLLPLEILERVLSFLDWKSILNCCQVNSLWNRKLSTSFNKLWFNLCIRELRLNDETTYSGSFSAASKWTYESSVNYKSVFVRLMSSHERLESGRMFRTWQLGPIDINAVAAYDNVLATATHRVKFWRLEALPTPPRRSPRKSSSFTAATTTSANAEDKVVEEAETSAWINFKSFQLQSRASALKFDSTYLLASTYFLTVDLYSIETESLLAQYMGHTCSITAFEFNAHPLGLLCTGSADNTIKFWLLAPSPHTSSPSMSYSSPLATLNSGSTDDLITNLPIKTEVNLVWPVKITIEKLNTNSDHNEYLVMALCANGYIFLNLVSPGPEISDTYKCLLNLQPPTEQLIEFEHGFFNSDDQNEPPIISNKSWIDLRAEQGLLTAFVVTENNSHQSKKMFRHAWRFRKNLTYAFFEFSPVIIGAHHQQLDDLTSSMTDGGGGGGLIDNTTSDIYAFLNKKMLKVPDLGLFEVVAFGFNYCLLLDESNLFYMCDLKEHKIVCVQSSLKFNNEATTAFRLHSSNSSQEQFVFSDRQWLNGFDLSQCGSRPNDDRNEFVCAFFTHKRNELFIIGWNR